MTLLMGLKKEQYNKLLHDIKRVSKGIKILKDEADAGKREFIMSLLEDEVNRLHDDLAEMLEKEQPS